MKTKQASGYITSGDGFPMHPSIDAGAVIWLTGLSGSGKTTLSDLVYGKLRQCGVQVVQVDGDSLRAGNQPPLGFTRADRDRNVRRAADIAFEQAASGAIVLVSLISPFRKARAAVAASAGRKRLRFAEVFINASLSECERRDPKGLYRRARAGRLKLFTGIDSPYEPPLAPDLEIDTVLETPAMASGRLFCFICMDVFSMRYKATC